MEDAHNVAVEPHPAWSYLIVTTALQSHLELWLGIMAANLPMMASYSRSGLPHRLDVYQAEHWWLLLAADGAHPNHEESATRT
jgi:hypothetical protein